MDEKLVVPVHTNIKKQAKLKAESLGVSLAGYVRMTIINDLRETGHIRSGKHESI